MARTLLALEIEFDPESTDPESLANAMDAITAHCQELDMFEDYGPVTVNGFRVIMEPADQHGRAWDLAWFERCLVCGQPDSFGDCTHEPLTDEQVVELGGTLPKTAEG